jgi:hypothetical protein
MAGLVPAIHVLLPYSKRKTWTPGTSPGMTGCKVGLALTSFLAYTGSPFCRANSFSDVCGRAPMC